MVETQAREKEKAGTGVMERKKERKVAKARSKRNENYGNYRFSRSYMKNYIHQEKENERTSKIL